MALAAEPGEPEDAQLVAAARRGDRTAFGALYHRHVRLVKAVLLARVPLDGVDDLVHDVFLNAMDGLAGLKDDRAFAGWLVTIARRRAADWRRRQRPTIEISPELPDRSPDPAEAGAGEVIAAISALPEAYRETLLLRFVAGMGGAEIAERTGLTHGSVRVNLHRGVAMLRRLLKGERDE